ncbi:MAG TPA: nicotinate phosphoribosyltransferase [Acidimicrobiales bacterium]|nr:nicotinate phosphoribosyltransferase [Acidimicrobiales bacterium]
MPGALVTDLYELTMAAAYLAEGLDRLPATFSLFCRSLPASRGFLVAAGLDDALEYLESLAFSPADLSILEALGLFGPGFLEHLATLRFTGSVRAVREGTVVLANEPLLEVDAPLLEAQLVETALLNRLTYQTGMATKAARLRLAAGSRTVSDFGLRSAPGPEAGLRLARSARVGGLRSSSNVAGAHRYGLETSGTMAHSYVLAHAEEAEALEGFVRLYGARSVLLVDTYDAVEGIRVAVEVARRFQAEGTTVAGLRIDSGNLAALARHARSLLDAADLGAVRIFATGGLDELSIQRLADGAPIDGFGVGAALALSGDAPVLETAYKLVELDGRPVRKLSAGKITWAGAKQVWRRPAGDVLALRGEPPPEEGAEALLVEVMAGGHRRPADDEFGSATDPAAAAGRLAFHLGRLPSEARRISDPRPPAALPSAALLALTESLAAQGR